MTRFLAYLRRLFTRQPKWNTWEEPMPWDEDYWNRKP
jgi:hypothetical protein